MARNESVHQKNFKKAAVLALPHHFGLTLPSQRLRQILNKRAKSFIEDGTNNFPQSKIDEYKKVSAKASLWHGTGRFHHSDKGITDVLKAIIGGGGLKPFLDAYAIFSGGEHMESISLTPSRIIARSYADMHGKASDEKGRYGTAFFWVSYYYGLFYARIYVFNTLSFIRNWSKWYALTHDEKGENTWGKKVNKSARDVWDIFSLGSDIPGNYPILFGITSVKDQVTLSKAFQTTETRTSSLIPLNTVTHIEVPADKVNEVSNLLKDTIPVFPIELGERVASTKPISELLVL